MGLVEVGRNLTTIYAQEALVSKLVCCLTMRWSVIIDPVKSVRAGYENLFDIVESAVDADKRFSRSGGGRLRTSGHHYRLITGTAEPQLKPGY